MILTIPFTMFQEEIIESKLPNFRPNSISKLAEKPVVDEAETNGHSHLFFLESLNFGLFAPLVVM